MQNEVFLLIQAVYTGTVCSEKFLTHALTFRIFGNSPVCTPHPTPCCV